MVKMFTPFLFLKKIRDKLLNIDVIYILVDTLDNAHTIFETLNNRGRDLEVIDLVKNYIFKSYPSQIANNKNEKWKGMIKDIKSNKKQFFNHFWASQYEKATQSKQYKSFLSYFEKATENEIKDFLDLLIDKAKLYKKITSPKIDDYKEKEKQPIFEALSNLVLFEIEQVRIFLLSLLYEFEKTKALKLKDVIRVLKSIEKFHFIFNTICKSKPSGIELMYSKFAIQLHKSENKKKVLDSLIEQLKNKTPSYNEYQEKFTSLDISASLGRYIVDTSYMTDDQSFFIYELDDPTKNRRFIFSSLKELKDVQIDKYRIPVDKKLSFELCHNLCVGSTGSGKSYWLYYYVIALLSRFGNDSIYVCDPKNSSMAIIGEKIGHVAITKEESHKLLRDFHQQMQERKQELSDLLKSGLDRDYRDFNLPPRVLIFDEYATFRDRKSVV